MNTNPVKRRAFTLIELVVATTIASLIVVTAATGLRMAIRSLQRGVRESERLDRVKAIAYAMRVELGSIYPFVEANPSQSSRTGPASQLTRDEALETPFFGGGDEIEFITARATTAAGNPGLQRVRYFVKTGEDGESPGLYKEIRPCFGWRVDQKVSDAGAEQPGRTELLIEPNVVAMTIEYENPSRAEEAASTPTIQSPTEPDAYDLSGGGTWVPEVPEVIKVTLDYGGVQVRIVVKTGANGAPAAEEVL